MHVCVAKSACQTPIAFSGILSQVRHVIGMNSQPHLFRLSLIPLSRKAFQECSFWYGKHFNFLFEGTRCSCTGQLPPLLYRDKRQKTASSGLHSWLQDPCYCTGLCSSYENKPHMVCSDDLADILLSFYTAADMHYKPFGLIKVSGKMVVSDCAAVIQLITLGIVWFCKLSIEQPSKPC